MFKRNKTENKEPNSEAEIKDGKILELMNIKAKEESIKNKETTEELKKLKATIETEKTENLERERIREECLKEIDNTKNYIIEHYKKELEIEKNMKEKLKKTIIRLQNKDD